MKFLLAMNHRGLGPIELSRWAPQDLSAHIGFMRRFAQRLEASGELVLAEGLAPPDQAKRVRGGERGEPVVDGVFPETKEFFVGFWVLEVADAARAYALAAEASMAPGPGGTPLRLPIEVRQILGAPPIDG